MTGSAVVLQRKRRTHARGCHLNYKTSATKLFILMWREDRSGPSSILITLGQARQTCDIRTY